MVDFNAAVHTTVLLVDDDIPQLKLRALAMRMFGFSVVTAGSPAEAISITNEGSFCKINVAVIDYHMPVMNGCILAQYLKARYPQLKIVLYSGAHDISEDEMSSVDHFIPKSDGIASLVGKIAECGQIKPANPSIFAVENSACLDAVN